MKYDNVELRRKRTRENRSLLGARFKILLADAGLSHDAAAQILHVTPRTIRYWISGKVTVPYSAYKLVRVMRLFELPCPGWDGWHMHSGKLWSPEGYAFLPSDSSWWNALVRRARLFHVLYERSRELDGTINRMRQARQSAAEPIRPGAATPTAVGDDALSPTAQRSGGEADRPNLLLTHFGTHIYSKVRFHWENRHLVSSANPLVVTNKSDL